MVPTVANEIQHQVIVWIFYATIMLDGMNYVADFLLLFLQLFDTPSLWEFLSKAKLQAHRGDHPQQRHNAAPNARLRYGGANPRW